MTVSQKKPLSVIFSNLQKAAGKQQKSEIEASFGRLSAAYDTAVSDIKDYEELKTRLTDELAGDYPELLAAAEEAGDRGVLRGHRWGQKVTTLQMSLIDRYISKGEQLLEGKNLYICEACGFIFLGTDVPAVCPVCKAPSSRFSKV